MKIHVRCDGKVYVTFDADCCRPKGLRNIKPESVGISLEYREILPDKFWDTRLITETRATMPRLRLKSRERSTNVS